MPRLHLHIFVYYIGRERLGVGKHAIDAVLPQCVLDEPTFVDEFLGYDMLVVIFFGVFGRIDEIGEFDVVEKHHEQPVALIEQSQIFELPLQ